MDNYDISAMLKAVATRTADKVKTVRKMLYIMVAMKKEDTITDKTVGNVERQWERHERV